MREIKCKRHPFARQDAERVPNEDKYHVEFKEPIRRGKLNYKEL